jgi:hypothetical protein
MSIIRIDNSDYQAQRIAITTASQRSNPFLTSNGIVRISASGDVHVRFGDVTVTATTQDIMLPLGTVEYFAVPSGTYIAVIGHSNANSVQFTAIESVD